MTNFRVRVEHDVVEYAEIEVEAANEQEAIEKVQAMQSGDFDWELTDWIGDDSYEVVQDE